MSTAVDLAEAAIASLAQVGASEDVLVDGNLITASDQWGDSWKVLVIDDVAAVEVIDGGERNTDHFVVVVAKGSEVEARSKLAEDEDNSSRHGILIWGFGDAPE